MAVPAPAFEDLVEGACSADEGAISVPRTLKEFDTFFARHVPTGFTGESAEHGSIMTYGEVLSEALGTMLERAAAEDARQETPEDGNSVDVGGDLLPCWPSASSKVFLDLGSGVGKGPIVASLWANVLQKVRYRLQKSIGVELSPHRHQSGLRAQQLLSELDPEYSADLAETLLLVEGDVLECALAYIAAADVIWVSNLLFPKETTARLARLVDAFCKPGCLLLASRELHLVREHEHCGGEILPQSWHAAHKVFVYKLGNTSRPCYGRQLLWPGWRCASAYYHTEKAFEARKREDREKRAEVASTSAGSSASSSVDEEEYGFRAHPRSISTKNTDPEEDFAAKKYSGRLGSHASGGEKEADVEIRFGPSFLLSLASVMWSPLAMCSGTGSTSSLGKKRFISTSLRMAASDCDRSSFVEDQQVQEDGVETKSDAPGSTPYLDQLTLLLDEKRRQIGGGPYTISLYTWVPLEDDRRRQTFWRENNQNFQTWSSADAKDERATVEEGGGTTPELGKELLSVDEHLGRCFSYWSLVDSIPRAGADSILSSVQDYAEIEPEETTNSNDYNEADAANDTATPYRDPSEKYGLYPWGLPCVPELFSAEWYAELKLPRQHLRCAVTDALLFFRSAETLLVPPAFGSGVDQNSGGNVPGAEKYRATEADDLSFSQFRRLVTQRLTWREWAFG
ncbi:unnamed protein product [Amoebophrya sp. A25]|nr:unnamed protein product [Amoebophrya sp. A25]|eukprot:GSA25T00015620001.1